MKSWRGYALGGRVIVSPIYACYWRGENDAQFQAEIGIDHIIAFVLWLAFALVHYS